MSSLIGAISLATLPIFLESIMHFEHHVARLPKDGSHMLSLVNFFFMIKIKKYYTPMSYD